MMTQFIRSLAALTCLLLFTGGGTAAAQQPGLDEALGGFDEAAPAQQDAGPLEDILQGFDEAAAPPPSDEVRPEKVSAWDLRGFFSLGASYNYRTHFSLDPGHTDYSGLSRLRSKLELILDGRISKAWDVSANGTGFVDSAYALQGREHYTHQVLETYASEAELKDTWVRGKLLPNLDLKIGRQIVVWGKSDSLRVTDVLNPLDNREPGLVDIEDLRLPLTMSRLDWYAGKWNVTGIAVHEIRFNKNPVFGSDFFPSPFPPPPEIVPDDGGSNTEYAAALNGILTGWDISFYVARIFDDAATFRAVPAGPPAAYLLVHERTSMAGMALNVALGNWLLKTEGAYFSGLRFAALPGRSFGRSDLLAGVEYSGLNETIVALEAANRHLHHYDESLANPLDAARQDQVQYAVRYQQDFLHQRLHLTLLALMAGWNGRDGKLQRLSMEYELTDTIAVTGGVANYGAGLGSFYRNIGKNDRVFGEVRYSF